MRTDRKHKKFIYSELKNGRIRQGWGYDPSQDLRALRTKVQGGTELSPRERSAWRGNRRLLADEQGGINAGDIIILPNLPDEGRWILVEITDNAYEFSISETGDHGHIRHAQIRFPTPVHPYAHAVSARLRGTMRTRSRLWNADRYRNEIAALLDALRAGEDLSIPSSEADHLRDLLASLRHRLWDELEKRFHGADFEGPVRRLLEKVYGGEVEHTGGRGERGADLICRFADDLGVEYSVVIQVKMWGGEGDISPALQQIETACEYYPEVSAGVVLTTLESLADETEEQVEEARSRLDRPILVLMREDVLDLFLKHIPDIVQEMPT